MRSFRDASLIEKKHAHEFARCHKQLQDLVFAAFRKVNDTWYRSRYRCCAAPDEHSEITCYVCHTANVRKFPARNKTELIRKTASAIGHMLVTRKAKLEENNIALN